MVGGQYRGLPVGQMCSGLGPSLQHTRCHCKKNSTTLLWNHITYQTPINFWAFIGPGIDFGLILLISYMITGWETKIFWHSPELGSLLNSLYKIPLAQACFPLARVNFHLHWRALVSQPVIMHRSFTSPTHLLSANVRGLISFAVSDLFHVFSYS